MSRGLGDVYKRQVCSGSISDEKIISYPKLDKGDSYTDEIDAPFSDAITDSEDEITDRVCMYGDSSANIKETGTIEAHPGLPAFLKIFHKLTIISIEARLPPINGNVPIDDVVDTPAE